MNCWIPSCEHTPARSNDLCPYHLKLERQAALHPEQIGHIDDLTVDERNAILAFKRGHKQSMADFCRENQISTFVFQWVRAIGEWSGKESTRKLTLRAARKAIEEDQAAGVLMESDLKVIARETAKTRKVYTLEDIRALLSKAPRSALSKAPSVDPLSRK